MDRETRPLKDVSKAPKGFFGSYTNLQTLLQINF